jgi:hypothetical protein
VVCGWSGEKPYESASWDWTDDLCVDFGAGDWRVLVTWKREEEDAEEAAGDVGAASVDWENRCAAGIRAGSAGIDALWESEVHVHFVHPVDDVLVGVVFYSVL